MKLSKTDLHVICSATVVFVIATAALIDRLDLAHRVAKAESQAKYYSDVVIKCINKRWFSFEDHLIFCDPVHAPIIATAQRQ